MPSKFIVSLEFKLKIREETEEGNNFSIGVESSKPRELDTYFPLNVDHITDQFTEVLKQNIELLTGIFEEHHKKVETVPPRDHWQRIEEFMTTTRGTTCPNCEKDVFVNLPDMKKGQRHTLRFTCCGYFRKVKAVGEIRAGDPVAITPAGLAIAVKDYPEPIMEEVESLASKVERFEKGVKEAVEIIEKGLKELMINDPDEYCRTLKDIRKCLLNV